MDRPQLILLGALVVLLGLAWASGVFDDRVSTVEAPELTVPSGPPDRISVGTGTDSVALEREGGDWRIAAPRAALADSAAVANLLDDVRGLTFDRVVTRSAERHGEYGVGTDAGRVRVSWPDRTIVVRAGDRAGGTTGRYVRVGNDDRVVIARGGVQINTDYASWRDKTLVSASPRTIDRVAVDRPDGGYTATRTSGGDWRVTPEEDDPATADSTSAARWVRRFSPLTADGLLPARSAGSVRGEATHEITIERSGARPVTLYFQQARDTVAAVGAQDAVFYLGASRLDRLAPDAESLVSGTASQSGAAAPPGGAPGGRAPPRGQIPIQPEGGQ